MTTRIEIKNEGPGEVKILAVNPNHPDQGIIESKIEITLAPGATVQKYLWSDVAILVKE